MNAASLFDTQRSLDGRRGLQQPWLWILAALLTGVLSGAWLQAERDRGASVVADSVTSERLDSAATSNLAANPQLNPPNSGVRQAPPVYGPMFPGTADEFFLALTKLPK